MNAQHSQSTEKPPALLIVDDEPGIIDVYRSWLGPAPAPKHRVRSSRRALKPRTERARYELLVATSGEQALELLSRERANDRRVLGGFFDMKMPGGIDGLETIRRARRLDPDLLCCVVTAHAGQPIDELRATFDRQDDHWDYISKPFTPEEIVQKARHIVAAWRRQRQQEADRARLENELMLSQKLEAVGRLAHGIAHEINTPLQCVASDLGFLDMSFREVIAFLETADESGALREIQRDIPCALDDMRQGVKRIHTIVTAMRDLARRDQTEMEAGDINAAIRGTLSVARPVYRGVSTVETDLGEIPLVRCHIGAIQQVLLNLVVNAIHAIQDRRAADPAEGVVRITSKAVQNDVVVRIEDNGSGIPPEAEKRIFEPFYTTKTRDRGSGQGLALAWKTVVDTHKGTLQFGRRDGGGTWFEVTLPTRGGD